MSNQYLELFGSEELLKLPNVNILMLPARRDDWTKEAMSIAKAIPTAQVYVGYRGGEMTNDTNYSKLENLLDSQTQEPHTSEATEIKVYNHEAKLNFPKQTQLTISSKLALILQQTKDTFSKSSILDRVHPFGFGVSHRRNLPFPKEFFDLSITQTPQATDVMHAMAYGTGHKSKQLFDTMKTDSFWMHFNTGFMTAEHTNPYFELKNELDLGKLNSDLLKTIHKGGRFLRPQAIEHVKSHPMYGEVVRSTGNNFELYKRRQQHITKS